MSENYRTILNVLGTPFVNEYSMSFDGVDEYFTIANNINLQISDTFSISQWIKFTGTSQQYVTNFGNDYGTYVINGKFAIVFRNTANTQKGLISTININDGNWHHVLAIKTTTNLYLYVDGVLESNSQGDVGRISTRSSSIGALFNGSIFFNGNIDEVALWNSDQSSNASSIYNGGVPTDLSILSPVSWWRMGDGDTWNGSIWTLTDNGSGGNDAISVNMEEADRLPISPSSFSLNSFSFDGVDESITLPNITIDNTSFTFSMWIKPINAISNDMLIQKQSTPRNAMFGLQSVSGSFCALVSYSDNSSSIKVQSNNIAKSDMLNNWSHVVIVRNGLNSTFYLNGVNIGGGTFASSQPSTIDIDKIGFGFNNWYFQGNIDEVAIWNSQLSSTDITNIYNSGVPNDISSLSPISWWRMGEEASWSGSAWTLTDQGSGGNNATSVNMEESDKTGDQAYVL